jgi:Domain of unknown function (DUF4824)
MKRSWTLIAGLALLALTNLVALGGALWNRSGEPEARLRMSERELHRVDPWYRNRENSGLSLRPIWRVLVDRAQNAELYTWGYAGAGGAPAWLDKAKMEALGFDASAASAVEGRSWTRYEKQLAREVLLVLELDGPAYRRALELVTEHAAREKAKPVDAEDKTALERWKNAREALEWETSRSSRLFVVDAGLDPEALRAKYPDRGRYAIVRGEVRPWILNPKDDKAAGYVSSVSVPSINVPLRLRKVFGDAKLSEYEPGPRTPFEATVAYGKRFEPWLVEATRK